MSSQCDFDMGARETWKGWSAWGCSDEAVILDDSSKMDLTVIMHSCCRLQLEVSFNNQAKGNFSKLIALQPYLLPESQTVSDFV